MYIALHVIYFCWWVVKCNKMLKLDIQNFFVYMSIENQIKNIVVKYWKEIMNYFLIASENNVITDIKDGFILKNINGPHWTNYLLFLLMNTDGVSLFRSNQKSLWPVQFYLYFLPPKLRFLQKNIIVGTLCMGDKKPAPLGKELTQIQNEGILFTFDN